MDQDKIASIVRRELEECDDAEAYTALVELCRAFAEQFASQDQRFDRESFLQACGIK
jgi:hypothetical protein